MPSDDVLREFLRAPFACSNCGEDDHQATGECVRGDSYCERARDMRRGIAEIDAALAAALEARE